MRGEPRPDPLFQVWRVVMKDLEDSSGFDKLKGSADVQAEDCRVRVACESAPGGLVEFLGSSSSADGVLVAVKGIAELGHNDFADGGCAIRLRFCRRQWVLFFRWV